MICQLPTDDPRIRFVEPGSITGAHAVPDMRLKLAPIPISDVDRAKAFYRAGWVRESARYPGHRHRAGRSTKPTGSSCSSSLELEWSYHRHDPWFAQRPSSCCRRHGRDPGWALIARGIELSDVDDLGRVLYSYFSDPDGECGPFSSGWTVIRLNPVLRQRCLAQIAPEQRSRHRRCHITLFWAPSQQLRGVPDPR